MKTKTLLIVAALLMVFGILLFGGTMMALNWNFKALSTSKYETHTHTVTEAYQHIRIEAATADVVFLPSENEKTEISVFENQHVTHTVKNENGTLHISDVDNRRWYHRIGINFDTPTITVCLPRASYESLSITVTTGDVTLPEGYTFHSLTVSTTTGDVTLKGEVTNDATVCTTTGDIEIKSFSANALLVSLTTGDITLDGVRADTLSLSGGTGDARLSDVIGTSSLSVDYTTGDIMLDRCDAAALSLKTTTGDISGSLLSPKAFTYSTTTGDVKLPDCVADSTCSLKTTTGDIRIVIAD